ncbi:MAG: DUF805 domain-containing protein [Burkholderiaceae bacterium]|jgi:uncharacterized membrane protein YhaH (DUF805 family)|nr:DUF805 domain-containing protein [Burkholderiaceae bacterium]
MNFTTAVKTCVLKKYARFTGRACRSELWWFFLFGTLCGMALLIVSAVLFPRGSKAMSVLFALFYLALLLPNVAVQVRRLHDVNRSGWWILLPLVPVVGSIILLVWMCSRGSAGANRFGEDPLASA